MLININDENRLVEIAASFRLEVLGEYSRRIFADRFDRKSCMAGTQVLTQ